MTHGSLFSGIGGFDLAAEWMGWENKFHCEWNPFGQKVLHHYFPNAEQFTDITKSDFTKYANKIDILTGGFPCQPYSQAGKRLGKEDERHLWPQMLRAIREIQPRWVVGENVFGLVNWSAGLVFHEVQTDLEAEGYEVQPYVLPAVSVNAPHRRDRVWFVAYSNGIGGRQDEWRGHRESDVINKVSKEFNASNTESERYEHKHTRNKKFSAQAEQGLYGRSSTQYGKCGDWKNFPTVSPICNGNDGIPDRLDSITFPKWRNESIKAGGNAVVPQVVYQIFKAIEQYENLNAWTSQ
jgi:DNA (cytosine-5)-methyltransferase 1